MRASESGRRRLKGSSQTPSEIWTISFWAEALSLQTTTHSINLYIDQHVKYNYGRGASRVEVGNETAVSLRRWLERQTLRELEEIELTPSLPSLSLTLASLQLGRCIRVSIDYHAFPNALAYSTPCSSRREVDTFKELGEEGEVWFVLSLCPSLPRPSPALLLTFPSSLSMHISFML